MTQYHEPRQIQKSQNLQVDIMYIEGEAFLITISDPLGLTIVTHLSSGKSAIALRKSLLEHISKYENAGMKIKAVTSDGEKGMGRVRNDLESKGIVLVQVAPEAHAAKVERKIRVVKERCRAIASSLPYKLCKAILINMVYFVVGRLNMMPSGTRVDRTPPRELLLGIKPDYKKQLTISFGSYVLPRKPNVVKNSITDFRVEEGIYLGPYDTKTEVAKVLTIPSGRIVARDQLVIGVMPHSVIERLNCIYEDERKNVRSNNPPAELTKDDQQEVPVPDEMVVPTPETVISGGYRDQVLKNQDVNSAEVASDIEEHTHKDIPNDISETPEHGYQTRSKDKAVFSDTDIFNGICNENYTFHVSLGEAKEKYGEEADTAIQAELRQLLEKDVWSPEKNYKGKTIPCSMFLKEKFHPDGTFDKLKARAVAGGHRQDRSEYEDVSSPTANISSVLLVATIAAIERRHVATIDITGAYLNASITSKNIFMKINKRIADELIKVDQSYSDKRNADGSVVVKLKKALYGCLESAQLWYNHLSTTLREIGLVHNPYDRCIFNRGTGADQCSVVVYVDDLLITCNSQSTIDAVINDIRLKYKHITVNKNCKVLSYLGMQLDYNFDGKVQISMKHFINDLLKRNNVTESRRCPADENVFIVNEKAEPLNETEKETFHSTAAQLLYLSKRCRPDILLPVSFLVTRVQSPTKEDENKLIRILQYLYGTIEDKLTLGGLQNEIVRIYAFFDASFGTHADLKSHSGSFISLGRGPIFIRSAKQKLNTRSSTEAELVAVCDEAVNAIWINMILKEQGYKDLRPPIILNDNTSCLSLIKNGRSNSKLTRHIEVRYFYLKDKLDQNEIELEHCPSESMIADILTKGLTGLVFRVLKEKLLGWTDIGLLKEALPAERVGEVPISNIREDPLFRKKVRFDDDRKSKAIS